jgi:hypothetical protein
VLSPTFIEIAVEGEPEVTDCPLTVMVAYELVRVGVTVIDDTPLTIESVYVVVTLLNAGVKVPLEIVKLDNEASLDILCTAIEYVLVVTPSLAVTTMDIDVSPTLVVIDPDALPEVTVTLFTLIVALGSTVVGVTVTDDTLLIILSVYEIVVLTNAGVNVPLEIVNPERSVLLLEVADCDAEYVNVERCT